LAILNFNYDKARQQAQRVEETADQLRALANNQMANAIASINASWDGESSNLFLRHCEETRARMLTRANELTEIASRIRKVAQILHDAEMEAKRKMEELARRAAAASTSGIV
jgi:WXG100 family type VII secretion target